jgi:putative membrane protein
MLGSSRQTIWMAAAVISAISGTMLACESDDATAPLTAEQQSTQIAATIRSDPNIVAVLHTSNLGEIAAGNLAITRGSDAAVKSFATQMVVEHTALNAQGNARAAAIGIPLTIPDNTLPAIIAAESDTLTAVPTGTRFDQVYIAQQVRDHQRTLALIDASIAIAQNAQIKALLQNTARPSVAMHLQMAQTIQARIGTP